MVGDLKILTHKSNLKGKHVLLRLDVNVPIEKTNRGTWRVADDSRIREAVPAVTRLQRAGAKIIIAAHLGEPKGKTVSDLRMHPVAARIRAHLQEEKHPVKEITTWDFREISKAVNALHEGETLILENLRFQKGEEKNDIAFAKKLAALADIYINEAFSVSHRKHASLVAITKYLPHYAGWRLAEEVGVLEHVRTKSKQPMVIIIGGAKVHDKIEMLVTLAPRAATILVGGISANTILRMNKIAIGRSRVDTKPPTKALRQLLKEHRELNGKNVPLLCLPIDGVVATSETARPRTVRWGRGEVVAKNEIIYDIGPETIRLFASVVRQARTLIWNGPMGLIEIPKFSHGSEAIARLVATRSRGVAFGIVGGGESLEVLHRTNMQQDVDFCSTGGGAMLKFLAGNKLPGIEALRS